MKNVLIIAVLAILMLNAKLGMAQGMAVNTTGSRADTSAMMDVNGTGKGVLIPRMTTAQRNAIVTPATGLMVYQTDGTAGFYYNSGTSTSPVWTPVGNIPTGTANGDMLYWNGSAWIRVAVGSNGQNLTFSGGVPTWVSPPFYDIYAASGANGTITPPGVTLLPPATSQAYSITPGTGYHISDVTVDGASVGAVTSYNFTPVSANHTISAAFAINTFSLVATSGANGTVTPSGTTTVSYGGSQVYNITPGTGYHVSDVTVDGGSVGAVTSYTFSSVSANHTISATFAINTYSLVATSGANGTVTPSGTTTVSYGGSQAYTITPGTGYHVSSVTVDGGSVGAVTSYTFSSVSANHTISATFAINTYSLVATTGANGTVTPSGTTTVNYGGSQVYSITPNTGYGVSSVTVDGTSVGAVTNYTFSSVSANHTISASFVTVSYTLTASSGANGTVTPSGATSVGSGGSQTYSITANTGYHISSVTVDGSSVGAVSSYTFSSVSANHTINATFAINTYSLVATSGANGTVTPSGTTTVSYGGSQAYSITANTGYHVNDVTVDGSSVGAVTSYTFSSVSANHTINASFAINTYSIVATSGANGTVTPSGTTTVSYGGSQVYNITPGSGFLVSDVTVDGTSVGAVTSYTFTGVTANHTISASFVFPPIGSSFGGGILAYILQPGDPGYSATVPHGLIAATSDQGSSIPWTSGSLTSTGASGTAIGTGSANTTAIIASQGAGTYAASVCHSYTGGGYTDWYLPSKDELNKLYLNQTSIGGFVNSFYWSSSESGFTGAWYQVMPSGSQSPTAKSSTGIAVRAVRSF